MMKRTYPANGLSLLARFGCLLSLACAGLFCATPASAATLQGPISGWEQGTEPNWVSMYAYVPDNVGANPPVLTIVHFCGGSAALVYGQALSGGMVEAADQYGFVLLFPQTTQNCWDVATEASLTHGAGGDTLAIVHQVDYMVMNYNANPDRVYIAGTSSGAMTTQAMAATYPDVFRGGVSFAGVPAGCWSVNNPDGQWSAPCAGGEVTKTAEEWGDLAANMYPGFTGVRPRLQLWHGLADSVLSPVNQTESVKQWTNLMGLNAAPNTVETVNIDGGDYTREQWLDSCDNVVLDVWTQPGGPHGTDANMNSAQSIPFLALDQLDPVDPQADCIPTVAAGDGSTADGAPLMTGGAAIGVGNPVAPIAELPSRPTMACEVTPWHGRGTAGVLSWGAVLALLALLIARRRRSFARVALASVN